MVSPAYFTYAGSGQALNEAGVPMAFINSSLSEKIIMRRSGERDRAFYKNYLYSTGAARHRGLLAPQKAYLFQW